MRRTRERWPLLVSSMRGERVLCNCSALADVLDALEKAEAGRDALERVLRAIHDEKTCAPESGREERCAARLRAEGDDEAAREVERVLGMDGGG